MREDGKKLKIEELYYSQISNKNKTEKINTT
jgi:hypothetical protein